MNYNKKLKSCRSCGGSTEYLIDWGKRPIVNNLQAKPGPTKTFAIEVSGCPQCGLVQIIDPIDPAEFYTNYANSSTLKREPHLEELVARIEGLLPIDAKLIDIGCNDGKFLKVLRDRGFKALYGLEPTKNMSELASLAGFPIFNSFLNLEASHEVIQRFGKFDCVVIRQVLEHIEHLVDFGKAIQNLLNPDGLLVIEVPDAQDHFDNSDYALWEEHINDFNLESLRNFLALNGFRVIDHYSSLFSGTCLTVISRPASRVNTEIEPATQTAQAFRFWAKSFSAFKQNLNNQISRALGPNSSVAVYGVGSRSSFFLNVTGLIEKVSFAIDDDPAKQGKFLAGTSIEIKSRAEGLKLLNENSLLLLGVNGENEDSLLAEIKPLISCECRSILPPSKYLLDAFTSKNKT